IVRLLQGREKEAAADLAAALRLEPDNAVAATHRARLLAASPDDSLRDGALALELAERARTLTDGKEFYALEALAAAFAELERFDQAIAEQTKALGLADSAKVRARAQAHLNLYQDHQPRRDPRP